MINLIVKKELKVFFRSPMAYLITGLFSMIIGWIFFNQLIYFIGHVQKMPVDLRSHFDFSNEVIIKMYGNVNFILLFFIPILCMGSFSKEFKDETINHYFTSAVSDYELIISKFLSFFIMGCFCISPILIFPMFLANLDITDFSFVITGLLGVLLNLAAYISVCLLVSCFFHGQIVSALAGFVSVFILWLIAMLASSTENFLVGQILRYLSINHHFQNFAKARISLSDICFYFSFLSISFFLMKKRLGVRTWR